MPRVRNIRIEVDEIFDEPDLAWFYRTVNGLKVNTRVEVVRREILLKEGEPFDSFLLAESERNLRSLPFLRQISLTPVYVGNDVDILVRVQDTWTLFPFLSLSSGGGRDKRAIGIREGNILGYGKRFELLVAEDEGRNKVEGVWDDRRLFGTFQRFTLGHFQRSDGQRTVGTWGRPFRSLVEPYAWSVKTDVFDLVGRLFENGEERFIYRQEHISFGTGFTFSRGNPEKLLRRYTLGYDYLNDQFSEADADDFEDINLDPGSLNQDPSLLAEDRRYSGPSLTFQQIEPDFLSINFVDRFERVEDFNLGNELSLRANFALDALGSNEDAIIVQFNDSDGWRVSPTSFMRGEIGGSFRVEEDNFRNILLQGRVKYFDILGPKYIGSLYIGKHTLASSMELTYGEKLDKDFELLLGAGNGLRGYKDRTFTGDQRLIINVEDRFHLFEDIFKLVSIGGAFFFDAGGTSDRGFGDLIGDRFFADIGFGLRFALPRSSGGTVVRLDIAFPLRDGPDGSEEYEPRILFTTGQAFDARLRSETLNSQSATVSAGFVP